MVYTSASSTGRLGSWTRCPAYPGRRTRLFLALHPNGRWLYATSEVEEFDGERQGALYAYEIDADAGSADPDKTCRLPGARGRAMRAWTRPVAICWRPTTTGAACASLRSTMTAAWSRCRASSSMRGRASTRTVRSRPTRTRSTWTRRIGFAYVPDLGQDKVVIYRLDLERGELVAKRSCVCRG